MRLLTKSKVQVTRYGEQFIDEFGNVSVAKNRNFQINCNWQPIANSTSKGELATILPSGTRIVDMLVLYSDQELQTDDEVKQTMADELLIEGVLYKVFLIRNWNRYLSVRHYEYYLIRKNKK